VYYAAVFFDGIMLASIGPTLDALSDQSGTTTGQISILFTANAAGFIGGSLLAARLYGRWRGNSVMAAGLLTMAVFTAAVPVVGTLWLLMAAFAGVGVAIGLIDVGGNTLLVWHYGAESPPLVNALHLSFGIGAFACPLIVDRFAVATDDAATAFWFFAALMIPVVLWLFKAPDPRQPAHSTQEHGRALVRRYAFFLGLMAALYVMHVGAELAFGGWIFSYADELRIGGATSARILNSVFWGGVVLGRLIGIPLSVRLSSRAMLQLDLAGAAAGLALIAALPDWSPSLWIGTAVFGIAIASMFATCINYTAEHVPITGEVMSILVVGAGIGSMTLPWLTGQLFDSRGPDAMLWVVASAIGAALVLLAWIDVQAGRMSEGR
jgi:fucose permease